MVRPRELEGGEKSLDPSENVKALARADVTRQDDLRKETNRRIDSELKHLKKLLKKGEKHQEELRRAEAARLNSIRQVDREDVNKTATQAQNAIAALAAVTTTTAETLRTTVANTASAQATALANSMGEVNKRLSALELSSSEGRGKATVESPIMGELAAELKAMRREQAEELAALRREQSAIANSQSNTTGQKQGILSSRDWIVAFIGLVLTLLTIYSLMGK